MKAYIHKVHYYETDKMGIVHHSNYIRWMEEARIGFLDQLGFSFARLEEMGIVSPVRAVSGQFKAPTTFDEKISIAVRVLEYNGVVLRLGYTMANASGALVYEGTSEHCFLNREGRFIRMKRDYSEFNDLLVQMAGTE